MGSKHNSSLESTCKQIIAKNHSFSTYAKFSEKLTF